MLAAASGTLTHTYTEGIQRQPPDACVSVVHVDEACLKSNSMQPA